MVQDKGIIVPPHLQGQDVTAYRVSRGGQTLAYVVSPRVQQQQIVSDLMTSETSDTVAQEPSDTKSASNPFENISVFLKRNKKQVINAVIVFGAGYLLYKLFKK